jgi:hypothetical protein
MFLFARVVEWLMAPGCKPGGVKSYVGSNPTPCTIWILDLGFWIENKSVFRNRESQVRRAGVAQLVERQPSKLNVASSSLVSRSKFFNY